jgi:hypothetical protein
MIHTAEIHNDNIVECDVITDTETYLNEHGYNTDDKTYYNVINQKPQAENTGYIIKTVETTRKPFEQADIVEDKITLYLCSCGAYRYQQGVEDVEENANLRWEACKHIKKLPEYKSQRAKSDDKQDTL